MTHERQTILQEAQALEPVLLTKQTHIQASARQVEADTVQLGSVQTETATTQKNDLSDMIDSRIQAKELVITPHSLAQALPLSERSIHLTRQARRSHGNILKGADQRLIAIAGPCSIHDPEAALQYADFIQTMRKKHQAQLEITMRAYMEKPRTELGWKGLVYDPLLDDSNHINLGLIMTRLLTQRITEKGVSIAMERLNANTPQYVNGLVTYDAIGARNTTDQKAREYASGTSSVVGFKNTPEGSVQVAAEAVKAANSPHTFLGMNSNGFPIQLKTTGNESAHVILRGDQNGPNHSAQHIANLNQLLRQKGLPETVVVDASHGNSGKIAARQREVIKDICQQMTMGESAIKGVMIESNLTGGKQKLETGKALEYGKSITDECIDLEETEEIFSMLSKAVIARKLKNK